MEGLQLELSRAGLAITKGLDQDILCQRAWVICWRAHEKRAFWEKLEPVLRLAGVLEGDDCCEKVTKLKRLHQATVRITHEMREIAKGRVARTVTHREADEQLAALAVRWMEEWRQMHG